MKIMREIISLLAMGTYRTVHRKARTMARTAGLWMDECSHIETSTASTGSKAL
jgi:hypothetical protein